MRLNRIAAAFSAARGQIMLPASPARTSDSISSGGQGHDRAGQKRGSMRLSASLQDFSTYSRLDPEGEGGVQFEIEGGHANPQTARAMHRETGGSSFSKEKPFSETHSTRKRLVRIVACVLCLFLFISLLYVCAVSFSRYWSQKSSQYYVILDCGSTGTRVYVYECFFDHNKVNAHLPISLRSLPEGVKRIRSSQSGPAYQRMETEPGFDKLVRNESGLRTAIKPLIRWAEKQIPDHAHKSTSLFVYATAGVRRLPAPDSEWLLAKVWLILKSSSFTCQRDWVKIISGMEEAYYGWIALNYQMDTIGSIPPKETFGALDLGGSSLQVTFETKEAVHGETGLNLTIGDIRHHLSAYSLSGYGLNDAFGKSVVHLLRRQQPPISLDDLKNGKKELKHPCLHSGYREQYICSQCALLDKEGSPLISGRYPGKGQAGIPITLVGDPMWEECSALARTTVNLSEWSNLTPGIDCEIQPCALVDSLPRPQGQFYAMSGFFVVYKFFNLTPDATLDEVLQKGQEFCEKTWEVAKNSVSPQPFIDQYCFRAPYIVSLLRDGLHIADRQVFIGSGSTTWTLGVALLEAGQALSSKIDLHGWGLHTEINRPALFSLLLLSFVLLFFALSFVGKWMPRFSRRSYLPLFRHNSPTSSSVLSLPYPFGFQRWSPMSSGDGRVKTPLSPTVSATGQDSFGMGHGLGGSSIQLIESSLHPSGVSVSHSYSAGSLGQMQFDSVVGSFWTPRRSQMQLQSRRSQSREDLISSLAEIHMKS